MANQAISSTENNFTKGLVTEFTGLNFPENAATDTANCVYTLIGDVTRREGINFEHNYLMNTGLQNRGNQAIADYKWNNAGGTGSQQILVQQIGATIYFFLASNANTVQPLSANMLVSNVSLLGFGTGGANIDTTQECQFTDGNGYLFIFHPNCDPMYCTYSGGVVTANVINVQIRDFDGIPETIPTSYRPATAALTAQHTYNLLNQGWIRGSPWQASTSGTIATTTGVRAFTVAAALTVSVGDKVNFISTAAKAPGGVPQPAGSFIMSGDVTGYAGTTLNVNITSVSSYWVGSSYGGTLNIIPTSVGYLSTWSGATGTYPSNADVWWYFKNASGVFDPATTIANVTLSASNAPRGRFTMSAFNQQRSVQSAVSGLTSISTFLRPKTGCWFQGRVWYTGVDDQQAATGDAPFYTWSGKIYFSKIVTGVSDFAQCYQTNDPTSANLFGLLPSDGGVISIPEAGRIYKLFPLQNALLVFAANGVWYLTGSTGIGFTANDYTIVKLSSVRSISSTSFVDVQGLPMFWNEEGIYQVQPAKQGQGLLNSPLHVNPLEVNPVTIGTILDFYSSIPLQSKKYVKGAYHPIDYIVQWTYKSANETSVTDRYQYDRILCYNTANKAFYPYTLSGTPWIHGVRYIEGSGGSISPAPTFKYFTSVFNAGIYSYTYSEESDTRYLDWFSYDNIGTSYNSYFVTGYKLHGQAQKRFQIPYLFMYSRLEGPVAYDVQTLWDYATTGDSGRWSAKQRTNISNPNFGVAVKRHRLRGQGLVVQIKVSSVDGQPFDIIGWAINETMNVGV